MIGYLWRIVLMGQGVNMITRNGPGPAEFKGSKFQPVWVRADKNPACPDPVPKGSGPVRVNPARFAA
jgi:hypothetical protein